MTALDGGFWGVAGGEGAPDGDTIGDFLPVTGPEVASPERVPFVFVSVD